MATNPNNHHLEIDNAGFFLQIDNAGHRLEIGRVLVTGVVGAEWKLDGDRTHAALCPSPAEAKLKASGVHGVLSTARTHGRLSAGRTHAEVIEE